MINTMAVWRTITKWRRRDLFWASDRRPLQISLYNETDLFPHEKRCHQPQILRFFASKMTEIYTLKDSILFY